MNDVRVNEKTRGSGQLRSSLRHRINIHKYYYLLLLPGIIWLFIFAYIPLMGITVAFQDYKIGHFFFDSPWVGLKWFIKFFQTPGFWDALRNTVILNLYSIIFVTPAPILLAILINEVRMVRFKKIVQSVSYLPHFLTWAVVGSFAFLISNPYSGIVNQIITTLGGDPISFLTDNSRIRGIIILFWVWKEMGWGSIVYLAAISNIPVELYEAAKMDGANKWQQITKITLPSMAFIISFMLIFKLSDIFGASFDMTYAMVNASTFKSGMNMALYIFNFALTKGQFSYGAAVGLAQAVIALILLVIANFFAKKMGHEGVF